MYSITKFFTFDAAHRLMDYQGKCSNIHGHTYKVEVTLHSVELSALGFVMDFGDLKKGVADLIEAWDHALILNESDTVMLEYCSTKLMKMQGNPTAENMACYLFKKIKEKTGKWVHVSKVRVWETPTSYAEYSL